MANYIYKIEVSYKTLRFYKLTAESGTDINQSELHEKSKKEFVKRC